MKIAIILLCISMTSVILGQPVMNYPNALQFSNKKNEENKENTTLKTIHMSLDHSHIDDTIQTLTRLYPNSLFLKSPTKNEIIIKSTEKTLRNIKKTIQKLNKSDQIIEFSIQIYEISSQSQHQFQTLLEPFQSGLKLTSDKQIILSTPTIQSILKTIQTTGNASLKANPVLKTTNNKSAFFKIGDLIPYLTVTSTATAEYTSLNQLETGINLSIKPKIITNSMLLCDIQFEMAMIKVWKMLETSEYPILSFRKINTTVTLKNNESLVLAGLIDEFQKKNTIKIPFLNKIPLIKHLFKQKSSDILKSDVCIIVTPNIIN